MLAVSVSPQFSSSHNFRNIHYSVDLITVLDTAFLTLKLLMSYIYIYIYGISSLGVNDLTLILLTWRKW